MASDDLSHLSIAIRNTALGARNVGGHQYRGLSFRYDDHRDERTRPDLDHAGGQDERALLLRGVLNAVAVVPAVRFGIAYGAFGGAVAGGQGTMQMYSHLMQAFASNHMEKTNASGISQSGPPLPLGRFSMFDAITFKGQSLSSGQGLSIENERGNVHSVAANDAIFSVPSDFTKQQ